MSLQNFIRGSTSLSGLNWDKIWILGPILLWFIVFISWKELIRFSYTRCLLVFLVYVVLHSFFVSIVGNVDLSIVGVAGWILWAGLFLTLSLGRTEKLVSAILSTMIFVAFINAVAHLIEALAGIQIRSAGSTIPFTDIYRYEGIGVNNGISSTQMLIGALISYYYLQQKYMFFKCTRLFIYLSFAVIFSGLMLSTIRGSIVLFFFSIFVLFVFKKRRTRNDYYFIFLNFLLTIVISTLFYGNETTEYMLFILKAFSPEDPGNIERLSLLSQYGGLLPRVIADTPVSIEGSVFGIGAGVFSYGAYYTPHGPLSFENSALRLRIELGIMGLILFSVFVYKVIRFALRSKGLSPTNVVYLTLLAVIILRSLQNDILQTWLGSLYFWGILGLLVHSVRLNFARR